MLLLEGDGGDGAVAGADKRVGGEAEDLLLNFFAGELEVFARAADRAGENRVTDDGDVRASSDHVPMM